MLFTTLILLAFLSLNAQNSKAQQVLVFNDDKSYFGENQALPAETPLLITAPLPQHIQRVELDLLPANAKSKDKPLSTVLWQAGWQGNSNGAYHLALNEPLRQNSNYDFYFRFYQLMDSSEVQSLKTRLFQNISLYLDQAYEHRGRKLRLRSSEKQMLLNLNDLIKQTLKPYRTHTQEAFESLSDLCLNKMRNLVGKIGRGQEGQENKTKHLGELEQLIQNELSPLFEQNFYRLSRDRYVKNYPTEKKRTIIAVNFGYAGLPLNYNQQNFNYSSGFYAGLSFPLGRHAFSPFWHRMSFSAGVFIPQLEDRFGAGIQAPFTKIPLYLGLGYRPWRFLRLQAGLTLLEAASANQPVLGLNQSLELRPFVGIGIELNIWADLAK